MKPYYETENGKLYCGDCLDIMSEFKQVDLILTDPPYGTMFNFGNDKNIRHGMKNKMSWDIAIKPQLIFGIADKSLRKNGKMILFSQQPHTTELLKSNTSNMQHSYNMIWEKTNFANSLIARKAPVNYYEEILVFKKKDDINCDNSLRKYSLKLKKFISLNCSQINKKLGNRSAVHFFSNTYDQFNICSESTYIKLIELFNIDKMDKFKTYDEIKSINNKFNAVFNLWEGKKYKSNILKYKNDYAGLHPTQKPILLIEDLIRTFSNDLNLVLDFCGGSGTTAVACERLNRKWIGIEISEEYCKIAAKRIENERKQLKMF